MKSSTRKWIEKAELDFATARRELRARRQPNYDGACFHAQQCIEKYLKANLVEYGIAFSKTHDLSLLLDLNLPRQPLWAIFRPKLIELTSFAVTFRYPGNSATRDMAKKAVGNCKEVRRAIRSAWHLPET
jgi:HEPN domain-containing protein